MEYGIWNMRMLRILPYRRSGNRILQSSTQSKVQVQNGGQNVYWERMQTIPPQPPVRRRFGTLRA